MGIVASQRAPLRETLSPQGDICVSRGHQPAVSIGNAK